MAMLNQDCIPIGHQDHPYRGHFPPQPPSRYKAGFASGPLGWYTPATPTLRTHCAPGISQRYAPAPPLPTQLLGCANTAPGLCMLLRPVGRNPPPSTTTRRNLILEHKLAMRPWSTGSRWVEHFHPNWIATTSGLYQAGILRILCTKSSGGSSRCGMGVSRRILSRSEISGEKMP